MSKELKIGLVVLLSIGVLFFGINFLKGKSIFSENNGYIAYYQSVDGLTASSPVTYKGLKVGSVSKVALNPDTKNIEVSINISNKNLSLTKSTVARITSSDLLGSKAVVLTLGASTESIEPGSVLISEVEEGLREAVNQQIAPLKNKAENLILSIDSVFTVVSSILNDGSVDDIKDGVKSLSTTLETFAGTARRIDTLVQKEKQVIERTLENLEEATRIVRDKRNEITNTIENISTISDSLAISNLPAAIKAFERSLNDASALLEDLQDGKGSIGKALKTDSLHDALMRNMMDLEDLLEDLRQNPNRYLNFSLIGRKDKGIKLSPRQEKKLENILED